MIGTVSHPLMSRRQAMAALASTAALPLVSACASDRPPSAPAVAGAGADEVGALALLDSCADHLLRLAPESATSLGIDTGARAALRSQLADRSAEGQQGVAAQLRADLARVNAFNITGLSHATRTSFEVVRSAYATALEGFALPYGDITVGGWRNTPYVVIQNVGAYLDVPRFLDSDHRIENATDAEAYLARLQSYARAARRRAWPHGGGARRRAGAAGVPDRQGRWRRCASRRRTRAKAARSSIPWRGERRPSPARGPSARGPSRHRRSRPRSTGSCRNCRPSAASPPTTPASRRDRAARSSTGGH